VASDAVSGRHGNAAPHAASAALRAAAVCAFPPPPVRAAAARPAPAPAAPERIQRREQNRLDRRFASLDGRELSSPLFRLHRRGIHIHTRYTYTHRLNQ